MSTKYEVVLGPAAIRIVVGLPEPEREELADALRTELLDGPNADKEAHFDSDMRPCDASSRPDDVVYTGTPLSFNSYVAIQRPVTGDELERLRQEQHRKVAKLGFYVLDILPPGTAFTRGPRLFGH
jgi:hypothetical protein